MAGAVETDSRPIAFTFAADLRSAEQARRVIDDALPGTAVSEETLFCLRLLTTELVTNAVRHARSEVQLVVRRLDSRIRAEVGDASTSRPVLPGEDTPTRHRGLHLLEDLSEKWGVDVGHDGGKVVWFEVDAAPTLPSDVIT